MIGLKYAYAALRYGEKQATVCLNSAKLPQPGAHAAAWLGASTPDAKNWIQGGIEIEYGDVGPSIYVEVGRNGLQQNLWRWPCHYGQKAVVRLRKTKAGWQCKVGAHPWRGPIPMAASAGTIRTLETLGGATATATLDGKVYSH